MTKWPFNKVMHVRRVSGSLVHRLVATQVPQGSKLLGCWESTFPSEALGVTNDPITCLVCLLTQWRYFQLFRDHGMTPP